MVTAVEFGDALVDSFFLLQQDGLDGAEVGSGVTGVGELLWQQLLLSVVIFTGASSTIGATFCSGFGVGIGEACTGAGVD